MNENKDSKDSKQGTSGTYNAKLNKFKIGNTRKSDVTISSEEIEIGTSVESVITPVKVTYKNSELIEKLGAKYSKGRPSFDLNTTAINEMHSKRRESGLEVTAEKSLFPVKPRSDSKRGSKMSITPLPPPDSAVWGKIKLENQELKVRFEGAASKSMNKIEGWYRLEPVVDPAKEGDEFGVDITNHQYAMRLRPVVADSENMELLITRKMLPQSIDLPQSGVVQISYPFMGNASSDDPGLHEVRRKILNGNKLSGSKKGRKPRGSKRGTMEEGDPGLSFDVPSELDKKFPRLSQSSKEIIEDHEKRTAFTEIVERVGINKSRATILKKKEYHFFKYQTSDCIIKKRKKTTFKERNLSQTLLNYKLLNLKMNLRELNQQSAGDNEYSSITSISSRKSNSQLQIAINFEKPYLFSSDSSSVTTKSVSINTISFDTLHSHAVKKKSIFAYSVPSLPTYHLKNYNSKVEVNMSKKSLQSYYVQDCKELIKTNFCKSFTNKENQPTLLEMNIISYEKKEKEKNILCRKLDEYNFVHINGFILNNKFFSHIFFQMFLFQEINETKCHKPNYQQIKQKNYEAHVIKNLKPLNKLKHKKEKSHNRESPVIQKLRKNNFIKSLNEFKFYVQRNKFDKALIKRRMKLCKSNIFHKWYHKYRIDCSNCKRIYIKKLIIKKEILYQKKRKENIKKFTGRKYIKINKKSLLIHKNNQNKKISNKTLLKIIPEEKSFIIEAISSNGSIKAKSNTKREKSTGKKHKHSSNKESKKKSKKSHSSYDKSLKKDSSYECVPDDDASSTDSKKKLKDKGKKHKKKEKTIEEDSEDLDSLSENSLKKKDSKDKKKKKKDSKVKDKSKGGGGGCCKSKTPKDKKKEKSKPKHKVSKKSSEKTERKPYEYNPPPTDLCICSEVSSQRSVESSGISTEPSHDSIVTSTVSQKSEDVPETPSSKSSAYVFPTPLVIQEEQSQRIPDNPQTEKTSDLEKHPPHPSSSHTKPVKRPSVTQRLSSHLKFWKSDKKPSFTSNSCKTGIKSKKEPPNGKHTVSGKFRVTADFDSAKLNIDVDARSRKQLIELISLITDFPGDKKR